MYATCFRVEARFSAPIQTGPGAHPASCTMGTGSLPGVESGWGVTMNPHPHLVPWSGKSGAIPLLPLWAVRPVQSPSACKNVHFTFTYMFRPFLRPSSRMSILKSYKGRYSKLKFKIVYRHWIFFFLY